MDKFPILLDITSPEDTLLHEYVSAVELPGDAGRFVVLKDHAPIISSLGRGVIRYTLADGDHRCIEIASGFMEAGGNHVTACVEL